MILDLSILNNYVYKEKFTLEDQENFFELANFSEYIITFDIKDQPVSLKLFGIPRLVWYNYIIYRVVAEAGLVPGTFCEKPAGSSHVIIRYQFMLIL